MRPKDDTAAVTEPETDSEVDRQNAAGFDADDDNVAQIAAALQAKGEPDEPDDDGLAEHVAALASALAQRVDEARASMKPPPGLRPEQELAFWRQREARLDAIAATEREMLRDLELLSHHAGARITRDDPRLNTANREAWRTSLDGILREEQARRQAAMAPRRRDANRYDGGSGGSRVQYDPRRYANTGNTADALVAKSRAQGLYR